MMLLRRRLRQFCIALLCLSACRSVVAEDMAPTPEQLEFFEAKVRPLLIEHCFECHSNGAKKLRGGLKLDSRAALLKGGDSGPAIVVGKPDESALIQSVRWQSFEMPPSRKLREDQIAVLSKWIQIGAPWPSDRETTEAAPKVYDWKQIRASHWAWQPVRRSAPPTVTQATWPKNALDHFVLARLEAAELQPSATAEPRTLIRRLSIDLTGLLPTPEEVAAFLREYDQSPDAAYEKLVDRLLDSPHYGERWGRHWLDVARYSDGFGGFLDGAALPHAWRYRDWVVAALNRDVPFDDFIKLQIAGDLIDPEQAVATGFLALGPTYISDGGDPDATAQAMSETLDDRVDTLSRGILGLTVSCARCHDHKFDPIPQLDYYSLAGVFNNGRLAEHPLAPPEVVKAFKDHQQLIKDTEQKHRELEVARKKDKRQLTDAEQQELSELKAKLEQLRKTAPPPFDAAHVINDSGNRDMHLAIRGNLRKPGPIAPRRFLRLLADEGTSSFQQGSGRQELAQALVSSQNPLTARVIVNRIWQQHFGAGLVRTPSNFGIVGEKPSHPELLDWLAAEFSGIDVPQSPSPTKAWSLKRLQRLIVMSATYRQSSQMNSAAFAVDGDNRLLWRTSPRRMDVEAWRDALLSVSGELETQLGGPPVSPMDGRRRTLYAAVSRNGDHFSSDAFLRLFDFPLPRATSEGRTSSIVPQQFLFALNSPFMVARAKALAARLQREATDDAARIERAYQLLYARPVTEQERALGLAFLQTPPADAENRQLTAWEQYAQVLLSSNELMHVN